MPDFVLYVRKFERNSLLNRKQFAIEIVHPEAANVPRKDLREKLAGTYSTPLDNVVIYGLRTCFGGGRSKAFACVYDSLSDRRKFDARHNMVRDGLEDKERPNRKGRREKKELRLRLKKMRGTEKNDHM